MNDTKPLRIAVLAQLESPTLTESLVPYLEQQGHVIDLVTISDVLLSSYFDDNRVRSLLTYDLVYYRSTSLEAKNAVLLDDFLFEHRIPFINGAYARYPYIRHKIYQMLQAGRNGVPVTTSLYSSATYEQLCSQLGAPFVAKADIGSKGQCVVLIESPDALAEVREQQDKTWFYQRFIPHDRDYRVRIINGSAVSVHSHTIGNDFRSNNMQGGTTVAVSEGEKKEQLQVLAERIARVFPLDISAIDLLEDRNTGEVLFTEINANLGWDREEIPIVGIDMDEAVLRYFQSIVCDGVVPYSLNRSSSGTLR
jgi:glutathione synthase/RimK-type ligase-like ATP-grasp enzyme